MNESITIERAVARCMATLNRVDTAKRATVYLSPKETVKVTRQRKKDKRWKSETFLVTVGAPNYAEREFIKTAAAAGEPFPIRKVLVKFWPYTRKSKRRLAA